MIYLLLGTEVSMETSNALLDLLCFHGYNAEPEKVAEAGLEPTTL